MTKEQAAYVRRYLGKTDGDDLERANMAFRGLTEEQLDQQYGQSGQTCREIWDDYRQRRAQHETAYWALDELLAEHGL